MIDPLWTSDEIAAATGGRATARFDVQGVSIDSRSVAPGDLFVALAGVRDGHEFAAGAFEARASGVLASQEIAQPSVLVSDTQRALEQLGLAARARSTKTRRAAITGSVGKTSVTQAVAAGLKLAGSAHWSVKSYNNHIGVPLSLARMPRDTERAVFEIGMNHADEIGPLSCMVRPHVAAVTTVGPVHIENFPDGEIGIARAKAEIFQGMDLGGIAVLNADNPWFELLAQAARDAGAQVRSFGAGQGCDAQLLDFEAGAGRAMVSARLHGRDLSIPILQTGFHWGANSLAVVLILEALGVDLDRSLAALAAFEPLEGRGAELVVAIPGGDFTLIDESYNANPLSMAAAVSTLGARQTSGRRIVALTDMLELGDQAGAFHAALSEPLAAAGIDQVFCAGPLMKSLWDVLPSTRRGGYAQEAGALAPLVSRAVEPGDLVMVKGSNGSKAGVVAAALRAVSARDGDAG